MYRISILDNHKIPRKCRKNHTFFVFNKDGEKPECSGAEWRSNNIYYEIYAVNNTQIDFKGYRVGFPINKNGYRQYDSSISFKLKESICVIHNNSYIQFNSGRVESN